MLILTLKRAKFPTVYSKITIRMKKMKQTDQKENIYKIFVNQKTEVSKQTGKTKNLHAITLRVTDVQFEIVI